MILKIRRLLRSDRGEANYFSTVVYIFVAVLLIAFILNVFSIISAKQQLDHAADQMVKQIQLSGGVNSDTEELFSYLSENISGARNLSYEIDATYLSSRPSGMRRAIQLGVPFYIPSAVQAAATSGVGTARHKSSRQSPSTLWTARNIMAATPSNLRFLTPCQALARARRQPTR